MRIIGLVILCFTLISCSKPDPTPELKDPIFSDLQQMQGATAQALDAEIKALEGHEKALAETIPQTGQIKFAQKRVAESKDRITRLGQEKKYLELKIEARKNASRAAYTQAFQNKTPWPDPQEWKSYQMEKKFREAKKTWDIKDRMKELGFGGEEKVKPPSSGGH